MDEQQDNNDNLLPQQDDVALPVPKLGLAEEVEQLMKLPQSHCKQRGDCCRVATFKGSLTLQQIKALGQTDSPNAEHARVFASIFEPYESQESARQVSDGFVDRVRDFVANVKDDNPDDITFFKCRFVLPDGRCGVHEDRPTGCRAYPFPHKHTIFHPGCGFEQQALKNWQRVEEILDMLGLDADEMLQGSE